MSAPALFRLAARLVPRPLREGVARDLEDEYGAGPTASRDTRESRRA